MFLKSEEGAIAMLSMNIDTLASTSVANSPKRRILIFARLDVAPISTWIDGG